MKNYTDDFSFILKPSTVPNAGVGVFAVHGIRSGTKLVLNKEGGESRVLKMDEIPEILQQYTIALGDGIRKAPQAFNHMWIVWYLNHSDTPNAELNQKENDYYAIRDILAGEEILIDYKVFHEPEGEKDSFY